MKPEEKVRTRVEDRELTLTNLSKVLYPATGFTKAQVIDYYLHIAPVLLPHIAGRPLTLKRYPDGVEGGFFYQKHAPDHRPDWVPTADIAAKESGSHEPIRQVIADDLPTLIWLANLADIEIHTPMWRRGHLGAPDLVVFDLDPGEPATIVECCRTAALLRPLLERLGLRPMAKTSGGKGLQLYAAVTGLTSEQTSGLARTLAEHLTRHHPDLVVSRMTKRLREGKVLIDWSQNNAAKTTVAPYSLRAMDRPTVSTPLTWEEVNACQDPAEPVFTSEEVLQRVAQYGDLFAPVLTAPTRQRTPFGGE